MVAAAYANGETMNAIDFDAVLPPGHVSPYVLPGALAIAESLGSSGRSLLSAVALSHEMSYRFGKAMDYTRDTKSGEISTASVLGYTSTIFGATAAIGKLQGVDRDVIADAIGIAANITPVNSHRSWFAHTPSSSVKYTMAGVVAQSALTAAYSAQMGHRGDRQVLDDTDFGYSKFIGTRRWVPENIVDALGAEWRFPAESTIKPYPHCRILHAPLDALIQIVTDNDIQPDEIDAIRAWGEAWVMQPIWLNTQIDRPVDGQFSIAHGLSVGAHRITPGPEWQTPETVFSGSVMRLMDKVTFEPHPKYVEELSKHPSARPTRIEVDARGTTFSSDRLFPKGSPSPDAGTHMTDDELIAKFHVNAKGILPEAEADAFVEAMLHLEDVDNVSAVFRRLGATSSNEATLSR